MPGRRTRLAAPFVAAGLIAAGAAVPSLSASAAPRLPARTATQLLASALHPRVRAFSGTVEWTPDLGIPSLGELTSGAGQGVPNGSATPTASSLLTGDESFEVWVDGPSRQRVATAAPLAESDVIHNGRSVWTWDSRTQKVVHYVLPAAGTHLTAGATSSAPSVPDPATVAADLISGLRTHGTAVSISRPLRVAGVAAYDLVLSPSGPSAARSTVSAVRIAIDAANGMPLRVTVAAKGQSAPALTIGFRTISFATPAASVFAAPHGARTVTKRLGGSSEPALRPLGSAGSHPGRLRSLGTGWTTVGVMHLAGNRSAQELDMAATAVSGRWGSGRLLSTSLLNVLVLRDGTALVGFVTPAALEADASLAG